jgi:hypothetical protein
VARSSVPIFSARTVLKVGFESKLDKHRFWLLQRSWLYHRHQGIVEDPGHGMREHCKK